MKTICDKEVIKTQFFEQIAQLMNVDSLQLRSSHFSIEAIEGKQSW
jgi:hypothetical protein